MYARIAKYLGNGLLALTLVLTLVAARGYYRGLSVPKSTYATADPAIQDALRQSAHMSANLWLCLILAWLLFTLLAALCVWALYASKVRQPMAQLLAQTRAIRNWRRNDPVDCSAPDVIGQLAGEFNHIWQENKKLRADLKASHTRQDARVNQQTKHLDKEMRSLRKTASTDPLSGLANRGHLDQQLPLYLEKARVEGTELSCLMIDIDNFKTLNDTQGHQAGDELIHFIGELLNASIRDEDLACRYGGDEFILLLPNCPTQEAEAVAERIRRMFVCESRRFKVDLGMSIGLASVLGADGQDPEELIKRADGSVYQAKQSGRNQVVSAV